MSPSARINAAIAGDKAQREAAYAALTALAHGDNPDVAGTLASASLHVSGALGEGELDEEARLAEAFGQFGSVLAVTLQREGTSCWALLTLGEAEEAQAAVAGAAASLGVSGLAVRALDSQLTFAALGEAGGMGDAMREHRGRVSVGVAVACVGPLMETIFGADVSVVDAKEYRRAASALGELAMLDIVQVIAEYLHNGRYVTTWSSMSNAYNAVFKKDPAELTREDALTVACDQTAHALWLSTGHDAALDAAGMTFADWYGPCMEHMKLQLGKSTDAFLERLCRLLLDILRDPQGVSDLTQAGAWSAMNWSISSKLAVAVPLIEAGLLELTVATMQRGSTAECLSRKSPVGMIVGIAWVVAWTLSTLRLPMCKPKLLLDSGFIDGTVSMLKTFELQGAEKVSDANIICILCCVMTLHTLDLTAPEATPIVTLLENMPSTLRFVLDNNLSHARDFGFTTATHATMLCAKMFGKREGGGGTFEFTQQMIDEMLTYLLFTFSGDCAIIYPTLEPFHLSSVVCLCISDANKTHLLQTSEPIKLIMEALLLNPEHVRNHGDLEQSDEVKGAIQCDAAESLMQLALFPPGRDVLQQDASVLDALHMLVDKALTEEARQYAEGALMALLPPEAVVHHHEIDMDARHVFMSYQWAVQAIVERIVAELQGRGYIVWFE